ncbi:outer envelope pore protein 21, chloroplastic [Vigna radiata var. radiata]|uniref:Outer envelope pore protein 21, chloroplastic n=1 Tax=Vigna radiata var. radiata TaxID=3916 RepID=A0A1S3U250_VIGRR|nr:outer envelope pore protein 21, chloroplastic [Vigna radiata var. radiata]
METSLRYGEDFKALRIHAKEKLRINSNTYVQMNGELDTKVGQLTSSSSILIKHFYSNLSSILGVGLRHDKREKFRYTVNAKTTIPVPVSVLKGSSEVDREFKELPNVLNFKIKGACDVDREFKEKKSRVAVEFSLNLFNFQKDQDIRLRLGCECLEKVLYLQIRENNWTINADYKGRWNVRYDL